MSSPPPTKPPRGVKQGKETSGLLMSVIRTLSASETNEQREKERAKLEKEYKKSDVRLDELVAEHAQEIMEVMQKFSAVSGALTSWGQHCDAAVARLAACRGLLRLRRDDLRRLWMDARTHHYALNMLTDIERVVVSERETRESLSAGRVLCAATTLRSALDTADTTLAHVTALSTTRQHLQAKKQELVGVIVSLVSAAVYRGEPAPLARTASARRRAALLLAELTKSEEITDAYLQDITPEFEASLTEEDKTFETTVMISLEALGVLEQLNEATEKFKCQIQNELLEIIDTVSRRIIEDGDVDVEVETECEEDDDIQIYEGVTETGRPLARLIVCLGEEFRAIGARNRRLLQLWRAALQKHKMSDALLHTEQHYWSAVQQVLQLLLSEYLQIDGAGGAGGAGAGPGAGEQRAAPPQPELRLSDYFAKKRPTRRKDKLFKLAPRAGCAGGGQRAARWARVCAPHAALLPAALPALHRLAADIELITGAAPCSLRVFVTDYVVWGESARLGSEARAAVDAAARDPLAWRELVQPPRTHQQSPGAIFSCVWSWWAAVERAGLGARLCGACGGGSAARAAPGALAAAGAAALAAHARLLPARPRAARWLADDDIVRFLQALPNWALLRDPDAVVAKQELKEAYEREAEILGTSLGDGAITNNEIVEDINTLVDLAVMSESMHWFSEKIKTLPSIISAPTSNGTSVKLSDNEIISSAKIFEDISQKCLLFLHLEMRIQCFYYLGQEGGGAEGGSRGAARLAGALLAAHERAALRPAAARYVFAGLAEMMSAAVVWRWQGCGTGAGAGAGAGAWLGTLRHCLAALALPHDGLHRAQAYLHLLNCTVEEIIQSIRERGSQFSELEYLNAFKVIGAREGLSPADMRNQLQKLSAALGHVGVTV